MLTNLTNFALNSMDLPRNAAISRKADDIREKNQHKNQDRARIVLGSYDKVCPKREIG